MIEAAGLAGVEVLKDEDYLASLAKVAPEEADAMLAGWGVTREELRAPSTRSPGGRSRSVAAARRGRVVRGESQFAVAMAGDPVRLDSPAMDIRYRSPLNRDVPPARAGRVRAARASARSRVWPPVVLAPMAGVTNPPFRTLCRRFGAGLYVSEMITARALVEGNRKTLLLAELRPRGDAAQPAALRRRSALRRRGGAAARRRGPRRPHRHELRLPGAQGHAQGRRRRDPAEAAPAAQRSCAPRCEAAGAVPVTIKFRIGHRRRAT